MNKEQTKKIQTIVSEKGFGTQLEQAIEEASEFILAAQKMKRYPDNKVRLHDLEEETGDLLIMMEQMRLYLGNDVVDGVVDFKLDRELKRLEEKA